MGILYGTFCGWLSCCDLPCPDVTGFFCREFRDMMGIEWNIPENHLPGYSWTLWVMVVGTSPTWQSNQQKHGDCGRRNGEWTSNNRDLRNLTNKNRDFTIENAGDTIGICIYIYYDTYIRTCVCIYIYIHNGIVPSGVRFHMVSRQIPELNGCPHMGRTWENTAKYGTSSVILSVKTLRTLDLPASHACF